MGLELNECYKPGETSRGKILISAIGHRIIRNINGSNIRVIISDIIKDINKHRKISNELLAKIENYSINNEKVLYELISFFNNEENVIRQLIETKGNYKNIDIEISKPYFLKIIEKVSLVKDENIINSLLKIGSKYIYSDKNIFNECLTLLEIRGPHTIDTIINIRNGNFNRHLIGDDTESGWASISEKNEIIKYLTGKGFTELINNYNSRIGNEVSNGSVSVLSLDTSNFKRIHDLTKRFKIVLLDRNQSEKISIYRYFQLLEKNKLNFQLEDGEDFIFMFEKVMNNFYGDEEFGIAISKLMEHGKEVLENNSYLNNGKRIKQYIGIRFIQTGEESLKKLSFKYTGIY